MSAGDAIAEALNELTEVEWDRCAGDPAGYFVAYGWIPRPDGHRDFVLVDFRNGEPWAFATSSAEHSERYDRKLFPNRPAGDHLPCQAIPATVPGVERLAPWQRPRSAPKSNG